MSMIFKKDLDNLESVFSRQITELIDQNNRIIIQNDRIIQVLEIIAGTEEETGNKVFIAETGEKICPNCKRMNTPENSYCLNCGTPI